MYDWSIIGALALGCVVVQYITQRAFESRTSYPLPPGPPGFPWIGNLIGVNKSAPWKTYAEWARTYGRFSATPSRISPAQVDIYTGDIVHSRLLGKHVIIINSEEIAEDLLENRSRNYSDRPHAIVSKMSVPVAYHNHQLNLSFKVWSRFQFCCIAVRGTVATAQAVFPPNVQARCSI